MLRIRTPCQGIVSLNGFVHGHWLWTLRKLDFWSCDGIGTACSPLPSPLLSRGKLSSKLINTSTLASFSTPRSPGETKWTTSAATQPSTPSINVCSAISVFNFSEANSRVRPACLEWTFSYWQSQVRTTTATSGSCSVHPSHFLAMPVPCSLINKCPCFLYSSNHLLPHPSPPYLLHSYTPLFSSHPLH